MLQSMAPYAALYALMLFVPGYLFLRCARLPRSYALCCAPILSTSLVGIVGEVFAAAHVPATHLTVYVPLCVLPLVVLGLIRMRGPQLRDNEQPEPPLEACRIPWWIVLLFAFMGLFICNNVFVSELPKLDAVMQHYDVQHHLNTTQAFADARCISSLKVGSYLSAADAAIVPFSGTSFYPSVWYGQCALLMLATGLSAPSAINVSLAMTLGLAYPLGMCAFAATIFEDKRHAAAFNAITCVSFATFPWCLLIFGPLYPNLVGFVLMAGSMSLWVCVFRTKLPLRARIPLVVAAVTSLCGQALLHPNTLFSMFVILVPFVAQLIFQTTRERGFSLPKAVAAVAGFLLVCLGFWIVCFKSPVFFIVVKEYWGNYAYSWQEVINILTQTYTFFFFTEITAQVLLGILVILGFVRAAYDKRTRWLAFSYLWTCAICYTCACIGKAKIKRFVAGFWYTDSMRVASMAMLVASLLAALGFDWLYVEACHVLDLYNARLERTTHPRIAAGVMAVVFIAFNFMPGFNWPGAHSESTKHIAEYRMEGHEYDSMSVRTTFGDYKARLRKGYVNSQFPIDAHEDVFLDEVAAIVGDDLVINTPYDGSTLAYGGYGIRTYYRRGHGYDGDSATAQSDAIRTGLCNIASDETVRQAVTDIDARYVLQLDMVNSEDSFMTLRSNIDDGAYDGIAAITPDTEGFTEVLTSGACHLYRIDEA